MQTPQQHQAAAAFQQQQLLARQQQQFQQAQQQQMMMAMQQQHSPLPHHPAVMSMPSSLPPPPQQSQLPFGPALPAPRAPLTNIALPKQQVTTVLNSMTGGGAQLRKMDGYDLANVHAMNVRYLQQVASQRGHHQHPNRRPDMAPPSAALFSAKM